MVEVVVAGSKLPVGPAVLAGSAVVDGITVARPSGPVPLALGFAVTREDSISEIMMRC
jgi:hypothetical protein